jgi:lipid A 4'-phosphatase
VRLLLGLLAALVAILIVFALWPGIDLDVSRIFYGATGFVGHTPAEHALRDFFRIPSFVALAAFIGLYGLRRFGVNVPCAPTGRALIFVVGTFAIGPVLLINYGLKDHAHRPRPAQTTEFGGKFEFRPWYRFDGECRVNCSFISGEASQNFWLVAPASLAPPPLRAPAIGAALVFAIAASLLRLVYGGHFPSDLLIAALVTLILVQGARMLLFGTRDPA